MTTLRLRILPLFAAAFAMVPGKTSAIPAIGDPVPKLPAYDAEGNSFDLAERLKGNYAVVVFGCLT